MLLAVVLEQQTELQPTQIMTDTGAYSDVVFGLFRLLGYHFSPRLADVGEPDSGDQALMPIMANSTDWQNNRLNWN
nr:Tn3 family transposase [Klebsiella pneumoniae]